MVCFAWRFRKVRGMGKVSCLQTISGRPVHKQNRVSSWLLQCTLPVCLLMAGCDLRRMGPPLPEAFAKEYLAEHGYGANDINALVEYGKIDHAMFLQLSGVSDVSVRHMLGRNSHLTREERAALLEDESAYVRAGVAMNPSLSKDEILMLSKEPQDSPVQSGLAINPFVPVEVLLRLDHEHTGLLGAFAANANCPTAIVKEIEEHGRSADKKLLAASQAKQRDWSYRYLGCKLPGGEQESAPSNGK